MFPPVPPWDGLHPLVIHFPIGLLLTVPLFIVLALLFPRLWKAFSLGAFVLMLVGAGWSYIAVSTGHAAGELVEQTPEIAKVLEQHGELGETVRLVFSILTAAYALLIFTPALARKTLRVRTRAVLDVLFLVVYLGGCLILINTGHLGGTLVHRYGVHAMMPKAQVTSEREH